MDDNIDVPIFSYKTKQSSQTAIYYLDELPKKEEDFDELDEAPADEDKASETDSEAELAITGAGELRGSDESVVTEEVVQETRSIRQLTPVAVDSIYVESEDVPDLLTGRRVSLRSLYPPSSWPSSADLQKDSDVYPKEEISDEGYSYIKSSSTVDLSRERSLFYVKSPYESQERIKKIKKTKKREIFPKRVEIATTRFPVVDEPPKKVCEHKPRDKIGKKKFIDDSFTPLKELFTFPLYYELLQKISFVEKMLISLDLRMDSEQGSREMEMPPGEQVNCEHRQSIDVGTFNLSIEYAANNIITYCTSHFSCIGTSGGSRLLSVIDYSFSLIEEKKSEWQCRSESKFEKSLHVVKEESHFVGFRKETTKTGLGDYREEYDLNGKGDLILDGGLFALMRYLIITKYQGEFRTWSLDVTGQICKCTFYVGKEKTIYIKNRPYNAIQIRKEIYREDFKPDVSKTYFLKNGHMIRHKWLGCKYYIHINPISQSLKHFEIENYENTWMNDIILMSKYMDYKQEKKAQITTYLNDNPEIKTMLQDYIQTLLQLKPDDVLDFSINYFANLCQG